MSNGNDNLNGGSGDDYLDGGDGNDKLSGGAGSDTLDGGSGSDSLNGGSGSDTLIYNISENQTAGTKDVYTGGSGIDTLVVEFTMAQWDNLAYRSQVSDFLTKLTQVTNATTGEVSNGSASDFTFTFGGSTLTVQMTETLQVFVHGVKVLDSTDRQALALAAPDLDAAADRGTSSTDNITNDSTPTLTGGGAEPLATVKLFDGTTLVGQTVAGLDGSWSITIDNGLALADGTHQLSVVQTDLIGNTSVASAALAVTIDTVAAQLAAPDLQAASDSGASSIDNVTNDATPTVSGGGAEAGATVTLYDGMTVLGTAVADAMGAWSITSSTLADGLHDLSVTQTDVAGNISVASLALAVTIDTVAAQLAAPDLQAASDSGASTTDDITNDATPTVGGTVAEAGATVTLYEGMTVLGTATADGMGAWSITSSMLTDGVHNLSVTQTDVAGNTSVASPALAVTIDTVAAQLAAPDLDAASDSANSTDNITNDATPTVSGAGAEAGATVTLYEGMTVLGTTVADPMGAWSITSSMLADGSHNLSVTQTDIAGNISMASPVLAVTIDTVAAPPTITSVGDDAAPIIGAVPNHGSTNDTTPTLTGTAEANSTVTIRDGVAVLGTAVASAAGAWSFTTAALADGAHSFSASITDVAGNTSAASASYAVTVVTNNAPTDITLSAVSGVGNAIPAAGVTIAALSTTDADAGDTFTYSLSGTNAASFAISGSSLATAVDLAQSTTYQFLLTSTDQQGASYTEGFRVITGSNAGGGDTTNGGSDDATAYNGEDVLLAGNGGTGAVTNVDMLFGFGGNDVLYGQGGRDQLHGGLGNDSLQGGAGNDTFYFDTALNGNTNVDHVTDFNADNADANNADKLLLSNSIFGLGSSGTLAAADFGTINTGGSGDLSSQSVGANVNIVFDGSTGGLYYDANGGSLSDAVQFAVVTVTNGAFDRTDILLGS